MAIKPIALKALRHPHALAFILLSALVLHWPIVFDQQFFADDFIHYQVFQQSQNWLDAAYSQFDFFHAQSSATQEMKQRGFLPWWLADDAKIYFFRPLATLDQALDYYLWPDNPRLMHLHSLLIVFLAWILAWHCYSKFLSREAAHLALLLLVLDVSIIVPLDWIAARNSLLLLLWSPLMLIVLDKKHALAEVLALAFYLLALLTAEAGVACFAWLLAYLVFLSKRSISQRLRIVIGALVLTVLWRVFYQWQGFGAQAVGQYVNPLSWAFVWQIVSQYPVVLLHVLTGAEASDFVLRGVWHWFEVVLAYLWILTPVALAYYLSVANRVWWFFYSAALLSSLPFAAISISDARLSILPFMAYAPALAILLLAAWEKAQLHWAAKVWVYSAILSHIILSTVFLLLWCASAKPDVDKLDARFNQFSGLLNTQPVLVANAVDNFRLMYYPYRMAYYHLPQVPSIRALMLAETTLEVTRLNQESYLLTQQHGMLLTARQVDAINQPRTSGIEGLSYLLSGFFSDGKRAFYIGQQWQFPELDLQIMALENGRPKTIKVHLKTSAVQWLYWDWDSRQYEKLAPLAIGETIKIRGQYENL